jgi:hypothetical protein
MHRSAGSHGGDDSRGCAGIEVEAAGRRRLGGSRKAARPDRCLGGADGRPRWTRPRCRTAARTSAHASLCGELDARNPDDTEAANCLPTGMPAIMGHPYPYEFLLTPGKVTIVSEAYQQVRHVYTDGRALPADPDPTFNGTSIGRWDRDTLVVETIGLSPLTTIARNTPHSDKMRIVERFRLTGPDMMSVETTVIDPEALTKPWTTTRTLARHRDWTIREYICEENNRNFVDAQGKAGVNLAQPAKKE